MATQSVFPASVPTRRTRKKIRRRLEDNWLELEDERGRVYFANAVTRETSWHPPAPLERHGLPGPDAAPGAGRSGQGAASGTPPAEPGHAKRLSLEQAGQAPLRSTHSPAKHDTAPSPNISGDAESKSFSQALEEWQRTYRSLGMRRGGSPKPPGQGAAAAPVPDSAELVGAPPEPAVSPPQSASRRQSVQTATGDDLPPKADISTSGLGVIVEPEPTAKGNFVVQHVVPGAAAAKTGRVHVGDVVEAINGVPVTGLTSQQLKDWVAAEVRTGVVTFALRKMMDAREEMGAGPSWRQGDLLNVDLLTSGRAGEKAGDHNGICHGEKHQQNLLQVVDLMQQLQDMTVALEREREAGRFLRQMCREREAALQELLQERERGDQKEIRAALETREREFERAMHQMETALLEKHAEDKRLWQREMERERETAAAREWSHSQEVKALKEALEERGNLAAETKAFHARAAQHIEENQGLRAQAQMLQQGNTRDDEAVPHKTAENEEFREREAEVAAKLRRFEQHVQELDNSTASLRHDNKLLHQENLALQREIQDLKTSRESTPSPGSSNSAGRKDRASGVAGIDDSPLPPPLTSRSPPGRSASPKVIFQGGGGSVAKGEASYDAPAIKPERRETAAEGHTTPPTGGENVHPNAGGEAESCPHSGKKLFQWKSPIEQVQLIYSPTPSPAVPSNVSCGPADSCAIKAANAAQVGTSIETDCAVGGGSEVVEKLLRALLSSATVAGPDGLAAAKTLGVKSLESQGRREIFASAGALHAIFAVASGQGIQGAVRKSCCLVLANLSLEDEGRRGLLQLVQEPAARMHGDGRGHGRGMGDGDGDRDTAAVFRFLLPLLQDDDEEMATHVALCLSNLVMVPQGKAAALASDAGGIIAESFQRATEKEFSGEGFCPGSRARYLAGALRYVLCAESAQIVSAQFPQLYDLLLTRAASKDATVARHCSVALRCLRAPPQPTGGGEDAGVTVSASFQYANVAGEVVM